MASMLSELNERLLTIKEVLEMSKVSRHTLYRDIKSGKLPAIHLGRNVRIRKSDATAYADHKATSKSVLYYKNKEA